MKKYNFLLLGLLFSIAGSTQSIKSYVITSAGAAMMGSDGAMYLSIGEPMSTEIAGGEVMISQGFLNVTIAGSVDTDDLQLLDEPVLAYPNPSMAEVTIEIPEWSGDYSYELYDMMGQLLKRENLNDSKESIDMTTLDGGTYFMRVIKDQASSKTLQIIKQ